MQVQAKYKNEGEKMSLQSQKKHILVMLASPHSDGAAAEMLKTFLSPFDDIENWKIDTWNVYEKKAQPCVACGICAKKEACAFDDLDKLDSLLRKSDLLVVASPVYNASFSAPFKAVLDRTQRYFEARFSLNIIPPIKRHRKAVLLVSMGSNEMFGVEVMIHQLKRAFTVMNTELAGTAVWKETDKGDKEKNSALESVKKLAEKILFEAENLY